MSVFRYLFQECPKMIVVVSLVSLAGGMCGAGLVALINYSLTSPRFSRSVLLLAFAFLVFGKILSGAISQQMLFRHAQQVTMNMCVRLCRDLTNSSLRNVESLGVPRIMATLTDDVNSLGSAIQSIPALIVNAAVLVGCSAYLAWLSWKAFLLLVVLGSAGVFMYRLLLQKTQAAMEVARQMRDALFGHFRAITEGIKEIRMNRSRREDLLENHLSMTLHNLNRQVVSVINRFIFTDSCSQFIFYSILGVLIFLLPIFSRLPITTLTGYAFAALYVMNPIWGMIYGLPSLQKGQIALERINNFQNSLPLEAASGIPIQEAKLKWKSLEVRNIVFGYCEREDFAHGFVLGPIDFTLKPGELVFVIGGNGSGKSTFVKLLCGLYTPQSGEILLDHSTVTDATREHYRQHFSVVFSDFYLFDRLLGLSKKDLDGRVEEYLVRLQLNQKVTLTGGTFSTTALSQGQRRRLALLVSYLEDRPIYVFDEWAADQDPDYKEVFYRSLLPELRSKGKAVVVITHDDRYFSLGDRIVRLDYGKVV